MCGPSSAMKAINSSIQTFAKTAQSEAGTVFDASSSVFHSIMDSVSGIVKGGPSQYGFSAGEQSAKTAAVVNAGAAEARNLKGAAASTVGAIGGGNVATPAGYSQNVVLSADQKAASDTATALNDVTQQGFEVGRENFFKGLDAEQKAPSAFDASTAANKNVVDAQSSAMTSQQNIDTQSNWAMNDVVKLGGAALSGWATGGFKLPGSGGSGGGTGAA